MNSQDQRNYLSGYSHGASSITEDKPAHLSFKVNHRNPKFREGYLQGYLQATVCKLKKEV